MVAPNLNMNGHLRATGGGRGRGTGHRVNQKTSWRLGHGVNQKTSWRLGHRVDQKTSWRLEQVNQKTSSDLVIRIRSYQCLLQQINKNWMKD